MDRSANSESNPTLREAKKQSKLVERWGARPGLCVDIRNVITHNRGILNRFFIQRYPQFGDDLGKRVVLGEEDRREMLNTLGYCARQLDVRAVKKFGLETIEPEFKESADRAVRRILNRCRGVSIVSSNN